MGLKGYSLWAMGQPAAPHHDGNQAVCLADGGVARQGVCLVVAVQVAFERQILKPGFHFIGHRLWV
jgi:hypothetical protein